MTLYHFGNVAALAVLPIYFLYKFSGLWVPKIKIENLSEKLIWFWFLGQSMGWLAVSTPAGFMCSRSCARCSFSRSSLKQSAQIQMWVSISWMNVWGAPQVKPKKANVNASLLLIFYRFAWFRRPRFCAQQDSWKRSLKVVNSKRWMGSSRNRLVEGFDSVARTVNLNISWNMRNSINLSFITSL